MTGKRKKYILFGTVLLLFIAAAVWAGVYFFRNRKLSGAPEKIMYSGAGGTVKSLDPAYADDLASRDLTALCYDTLVQYDYLARPYKLIPSMLESMPEISADRKSYTFTLRPDLLFAADPAFSHPGERKVTAGDVKFSILRIADARNHSPVYWIFRDKISGIGKFREKSAKAAKGDLSLYDEDIPGIKILSDRRFVITLDAPDPGFLYLLAMPNTGIVSRKAASAGNRDLSRAPAGSGPFILKEWIPDLHLYFSRNPDYRAEYFPHAADPADRQKKLPLLDGIKISQVRQMMTQWMLFLQGNLDCNALDKDNQETIAGNGTLLPALAARDVVMEYHPEFEIRYVGFNFRDPVLGKNIALRRALRAAYDIRRRINHASGMLLPAAGPIPQGISGFVAPAEAVTPDPAEIRELFIRAGYPGGVDPASGRPLELTFDQAGSSVGHRQMGNLPLMTGAKPECRSYPGSTAVRGFPINCGGGNFSFSVTPGSVIIRTGQIFYSSFTPEISAAATTAVLPTGNLTGSMKRRSPCRIPRKGANCICRWSNCWRISASGYMRVSRYPEFCVTAGCRTACRMTSVSPAGSIFRWTLK